MNASQQVAAALAVAAASTAALWTADASARTVLNETACHAGGVQTTDPQDLAVDVLGARHYVADTGNGRVYVKPFGSACSHTIQGTDSGGLTLQEPWGVALDAQERIYVSDRQTDSVWKYQPASSVPAGTSPPLVGAFANLGLDDPRGLGADDLNRIYIADSGNGRVVRMSAGGAFVDALGTPDDGTGGSAGELLTPVDVAVCADVVYVVDQARGNVQAFDADGHFAFAFGREGAGLGQLKDPSGIDVDGQCNVYVADTGNGRSQMFDAKGNFLEVIERGFDDAVTGIASSKLFTWQHSGVSVTSPDRDSVTRYEWIDYDQTADGDIDSDGDGIPELWEVEGIDVDGDGTPDYELPGADPLRKELYVEADFTGGLAPLPVSGVPGAVDHFDLVEEAFRKAPVTNPNGTTGIDLVVERGDRIDHDGEGIAFRTDMDAPDADFTFSNLKHAYFGSAAERQQPGAAKRLTAKRLVFRYVLHARSICAEATLEPQPACLQTAYYAGDAELPGDDAVIAVKQTSAIRQAGLFMHELGHTLGLRHGGHDDVNCKPNYLSVMSYAFRDGIINPHAPFGRRLDYSRADLRDLDERDLHEPSGVGAQPVGRGGFLTDHTVWSVDGVNLKFQRADRPIDWDADGDPLEPDTVLNVNALPIDGCTDGAGGPVLEGHDDWANLTYAFRAARDFEVPALSS